MWWRVGDIERISSGRFCLRSNWFVYLMHFGKAIVYRATKLRRNFVFSRTFIHSVWWIGECVSIEKRRERGVEYVRFFTANSPMCTSNSSVQSADSARRRTWCKPKINLCDAKTTRDRCISSHFICAQHIPCRWDGCILSCSLRWTYLATFSLAMMRHGRL